MDLLIEGTGAMACLFAARLSRAGFGVTVSGTWHEGIQAMRTNGVRLIDADGVERHFPVRVAERECDSGRYEHAVVLVKSWQTEQAANRLRHCLAQDGLALTLQNGLGNQEKLAAVLGKKRVCLGVTTAGATLLGPGRVRAAGSGKVSLGSHPGIEPIADALQQSGFSIEIVSDPDALLWGKLVINAAINPLTALMRIPNGELLKRPTARNLMKDAAKEASEVAAALKIKLPYTDPVKMVGEVAMRTAENRSSMLQDVLRGAPTEIDAISGAIVRAGEEASIPTPVNLTLWRLVKGLESYGEQGIMDKKP
jgi:2-dehydropantoate 2-reductase